MVLRRAVLADADGLALLHMRSWQAGYRGIVADDVLNGLRLVDFARRWNGRLSGAEPSTMTFLAEREGRLAGFCVAGPSTLGDEGPQTAEVYALYVEPDFYRQGTGRMLLARAVVHLRDTGFSQAALWVLTENRRGRLFYEANGWKDSRRTNVLPIGEERRYVTVL